MLLLWRLVGCGCCGVTHPDDTSQSAYHFFRQIFFFFVPADQRPYHHHHQQHQPHQLRTLNTSAQLQDIVNGLNGSHQSRIKTTTQRLLPWNHYDTKNMTETAACHPPSRTEPSPQGRGLDLGLLRKVPLEIQLCIRERISESCKEWNNSVRKTVFERISRSKAKHQIPLRPPKKNTHPHAYNNNKHKQATRRHEGRT